VTKLTEVIELEGNWEVGLTEIMIPCTLHNVGGGSFYYTVLFDAQPSTIRCEMSSGVYATNAEVVRELWRIGRMPNNSQVINWEYLASKKRIALKDVS